MLDSRWVGAGIAQLVERELPKLEVAGSRPVARSKIHLPPLAARTGRWILSIGRRGGTGPAPKSDGGNEIAGQPGGARTIIGPQTRFKGRLKGQGEVVVCGTLLGEIDIAGPLTVAATGRVEADMEVQGP